MTEPPKEEERMSFMLIPRHSALKFHYFEESTASKYSAELFAGGDVLRAGVYFTH